MGVCCPGPTGARPATKRRAVFHLASTKSSLHKPAKASRISLRQRVKSMPVDLLGPPGLSCRPELLQRRVRLHCRILATARPYLPLLHRVRRMLGGNFVGVGSVPSDRGVMCGCAGGCSLDVRGHGCVPAIARCVVVVCHRRQSRRRGRRVRLPALSHSCPRAIASAAAPSMARPPATLGPLRISRSSWASVTPAPVTTTAAPGSVGRHWHRRSRCLRCSRRFGWPDDVDFTAVMSQKAVSGQLRGHRGAGST